jgi:tyrosyl-tRNA synthetase
LHRIHVNLIKPKVIFPNILQLGQNMSEKHAPLDQEVTREEKERSDQVQRILTIGKCVERDELVALLEAIQAGRRGPMICYNGFEPSGRLTLAQCLLAVNHANLLASMGATFKFWIADWFAQLNQKLSGDLEKIRLAGELMIETFRVAGLTQGEFLWASEEINKEANRYWSIVRDITMNFTLSRMKRCTPALGRDDKTEADVITDEDGRTMVKSDTMPLGYLMYAAMQCADIFFLNVDVCQLGEDQDKVNMLAREYAPKMHPNLNGGRKRRFKPIILSHHMLMGLNGETKMAKSTPNNAIFMDDTPAEVARKINSAFCEIGNVSKNPLLEYIKYLLLPRLKEFRITRLPEHGGDRVYLDYAQIETDFLQGRLHPSDLKTAVTRTINQVLEPVQRHFTEDPRARQLAQRVRSFTLTR